ncbi:uncharacterized protein LOC111633365 [Centruroides sculpturatus]|uniref:uncharacterized protein LOC111633365 n=1 Tax=Centruroides sculpturatus TaxID=218467 RepID=UPI000C6EACD1|nr:uncharacterized protein LOC111633365 [Centruroides sculpturatus]
MMPTCLLVLFFAAGVALAYSPFQTNQYMDTVLHTNLPADGAYSNIDPARLGNFTFERRTKVMFINVKVKIDYYNGNMTGMFRGRRARDCSPIYRGPYGNATLNCTVEFRDIKFQFQGKLKYGKLPTTSITVTGSMSPSYAYVEVTSRYEFNSPSLRTMHLTQTGKVTSKFTGLGPLNNELKKFAEDEFNQRLTSEFFNVFTYNYFPAMGRACTRTRMPL